MLKSCAWRMAALALASSALVSCHAVSTSSKTRIDADVVSSPPDAGQTDPSLDYKKQLDVQAMRGLRYDTGLVTIDAAEANTIVPNPDAASAYNFYQSGVNELMVNNDRHAAIAAFSRAVINNPGEPYLYEGLGRALRNKGKAAEAQAAFRTALRLSPNWAEAHYQLGMTQAMFGHQEDAVKSWLRAVELEPTHGEAHIRIAIESYYHNEFDAAWTHLKQAQANNAEIPAQFPALLSKASGRSN
jgi:tetratricopeptide (TPR) repeat protein